MISPNRCEPWTENDFFALREWRGRLQLLDGDLLISAAPTVGHQQIVGSLALSLDRGAEVDKRHVLTTTYLRLKPGRIAIPDLVVVSDINPEEPTVPAHAAELVCEVTSPESTATDKVLKMHYYAEAGIPWYLIVEHKTITLRLFRLQNGSYVERHTAEPGEVLRLTEPVTAEIRPESLLP